MTHKSQSFVLRISSASQMNNREHICVLSGISLEKIVSILMHKYNEIKLFILKYCPWYFMFD
jgi:hypothetical protein